MGRKRKTGEKLPPYVYLAKGRYILRPYRDGKLQAEIRLCIDNSTLAEVWAAYEAAVGKPRDTFRWLATEYFGSSQYRRLSRSTKRSYEAAFARIVDAPLVNGHVFGDIPLKTITPGVIRKYMDKRGATSPVVANRERAFMSTVFAWGFERDLCSANPCIGVRGFKESHRTRYVTDEEYSSVLYLARSTTATPYLWIVMELSYLCRARGVEVRGLCQTDIMPDGLLIRRRKRSKTGVAGWTPRLRAAVDAALALPGEKHPQRWLLHGRDGQQINGSTLETAWQRLMIRAVTSGLVAERFTLHDLKAKGVSDFRGDKKRASGHRSDAMVDVYDRKPDVVEASR